MFFVKQFVVFQICYSHPYKQIEGGGDNQIERSHYDCVQVNKTIVETWKVQGQGLLYEWNAHLEIHVEFNDGGFAPCNVKFTKLLPL